jgi:hypothetical protein
LAWEAEHPERSDPEVYWRDVYPLVKDMQVNHIGQATGLSRGQAWRIKHGLIVPHARWWENLAKLGDHGATRPSVAAIDDPDASDLTPRFQREHSLVVQQAAVPTQSSGVLSVTEVSEPRLTVPGSLL